MKTLFCLIFFSFSLNFFFAQDDGSDAPTAVPFVAYWSKGDIYKFRVTKTKTDKNVGEKEEKDSNSYDLVFNVIDSTATKYTISWKFKTDFESYKIPKEYESKLSKYKFTEVIYETDELGAFVEIKNWREIAAMIKTMMKDVSSLIGTEELKKNKTLEKFMKEFTAIVTTKEAISSYIFPEIQYFHFPFGAEFTPGEELEYEEELANILGGDPVRGESKIYLKDVDFEEEQCVLIHEMEVNPGDAKRMINDFFKKMGMKDDEMKKALKTSKISISDNNVFEYYYNPGVPIRIETTRETEIIMSGDNKFSTKVCRIELLD